MTSRRAVITGIGMIGPTGAGYRAFWDALCAARPAARPISRFDPSVSPCRVAGEVDDSWFVDHVDARKRRTTTRATQLALAASDLALADARLPSDAIPRDAFGVVVGTAMGGWVDGEQQTAILLERGGRRVNPFIVAGAPSHGPGVEVAAAAGARGPQVTFANGCPSSAQAIAHGAMLIESGVVDGCLVGGTEAPLSPLTFAALSRTNELSTEGDPLRASRPFDQTHAGMVLSEGATFLMLECSDRARARGATIYATILGSAFSCDAEGLYTADHTGQAGASAIRRLLTITKTRPDDIDYICAHANAAPLFDRKDITVLSAALGEFLPTIPISSIKGVLGHPFGASGAFQAAAASLAMSRSVIPPTANLESPADACRARHVIAAPLERELRRVLLTSYGYGGVNGYLLLGSAADV